MTSFDIQRENAIEPENSTEQPTAETFTCAECDETLPIRPSVITGVTDTDPGRHICLPCWRDGKSLTKVKHE
jgi:hypothetical protein